ncbi:PHD finger protein 7-like [Acridotheres tristis]
MPAVSGQRMQKLGAREDNHLERTEAFRHRDSLLTRTMSERTQESPDAREPACMLCHRTEADPDICGDKLEKFGLCAHVFCLYFATLILHQGNKRVGLMGFLPRDIQLAVRRAAKEHCCVCGQSGATILCCEENCGRWFHLPCAKEGGCVNLYISPHSSYCSEHRPEPDVQATPEPGTECLICMEPVEDGMSYGTLVCPACTRAWFHRDCIQGQAMRAGLLSFQCPLCRDRLQFLLHVFIMGIRVPFRFVSFSLAHKTGGRRQPTWEDNDAFADLGERHSQCNARECLYPGGREEAEEEGIRGHQPQLPQPSAIGSGSSVSRDQHVQELPVRSSAAVAATFLPRHQQPKNIRANIQQLHRP